MSCDNTVIGYIDSTLGYISVVTSNLHSIAAIV